MKTKNLDDFNRAATSDPKLKQRVQDAWVKMESACDPHYKSYAASIVQAGKDNGYAFSEADVASLRMGGGSELSPEQLGNVVGGAGTVQAVSVIAPRLDTSTLNLVEFNVPNRLKAGGVT